MCTSPGHALEEQSLVWRCQCSDGVWSHVVLVAHHAVPHHCWDCYVPASKILIYTRTLSMSQLVRSLDNLLNIKPPLFCSRRNSRRSCSASRGTLQGFPRMCITGMVSLACPTIPTTNPEQRQELQRQRTALMLNRPRNSFQLRGWNTGVESLPSGGGGSHGNSRAEGLRNRRVELPSRRSGCVLTQQAL